MRCRSTHNDLRHAPGDQGDAQQVQQDDVDEMEQHRSDVIAPRVEAEYFIGEALDQPADRLADAAGEVRECELDLLPAETAERIVLKNLRLVVPVDEAVIEHR